MTGNTCIKCKSPAYVSLLGSIECSNKRCEHYSADLYPEKVEQSSPKRTLVDSDITTTDQSSEEDEDDGAHTPQHLWTHYHTDVGW